MILMEHYDAAVGRSEIDDDPLQRNVVVHLQHVADELGKPSPWYKFGQRSPVIGLYLYGPVGVGKTYLMDLFYDSVAEKHKVRFHFHHFMQQIDAQLRRLQGQKDPLRRIAAELAKTTRLLCLDEFLVHDVADAMILAALLQAIFSHDVVIVATANTAPDDLYLDGVHRERFLPVIALIKQQCDVLCLSEDHDYRLGRSPLLHAYLYPLNDVTQQTLSKQFSVIAPDARTGVELSIQHRLILAEQCGEHAVWFEFNVICNLPRCQLDYLEIADRFETVFISNMPVLSPDDTVRAILLIHFIDVMYDRGIRLVISAAVPATGLYISGAMFTMFQRTLSRLEEMQSADYLQRHGHRDIQLW